MVQFDWSILVDAADLEVLLLVLEIPHKKCLLKMKMYRQHIPFILMLAAQHTDIGSKIFVRILNV